MINSISLRNLEFFGKEAMKIIRESTVAVCGVGGLGCVVAEILVRLGVGKLILVDKSKVDEPDLGRQLLYDLSSLGKEKVYEAKNKLESFGFSKIYAYHTDINASDLSFLRDANVIADCLDNFQTRFSLEKKLLPWQVLVHGSVEKSYGQVTTISKDTLHLKEIYSGVKDKNRDIPVSTMAVFFIGALMSEEIVNSLLSKPKLKNVLLIANLGDFSISKIKLSSN